MTNQQILKKSITDFKKNGYTVFKSLLTKNEILEAKKEVQKISKIIKKKYKPPYVYLTKDSKIDTLHGLHKFFPNSILLKFAKKKIVKSFYKAICKDNSKIWKLQIFAKPKNTGLAAPFHQDNYYWNVQNSKILSIWISLDRVTKKNGGVIYCKGSHKVGLLKHVNSNFKGFSMIIPNNTLNKFKFNKYTPNLNPGDCLLHHCQVIHGSNKNISNMNRRGVAIRLFGKKTKFNKNKVEFYKNQLKNQTVRLFGKN